LISNNSIFRENATSSFGVAAFGATGHFIPASFPLLSPGKWTTTDDADFGWKVLFIYLLLWAISFTSSAKELRRPMESS